MANGSITTAADGLSASLDFGGTPVVRWDGTGITSGVNGGALVADTAKSATGTSVDFTGIPSWVKRITVIFNGVSTNGSSPIIVQLGDSGGVETSGYAGSAITLSSSTNGVASLTIGIYGSASGASGAIMTGQITITKLSAAVNTWVGTGIVGGEDAAYEIVTAARKTLSDVLDRVRITTVNGTDTFDAGTINILYE